MTQSDDLTRRLAEIAHVLSLTTDALIALSVYGEADDASLEADASEVAANFRMIADPDARQRLLCLSRELANTPAAPDQSTA